MLNKMLPEMKYLATNYEPDVWWSDGDWEAKPEYFGSQDFLAWLYNESPSKDTVVTNDRYVNNSAQSVSQTLKVSLKLQFLIAPIQL